MFLDKFWAECDHHDKFQPRPWHFRLQKRSDSYTQRPSLKLSENRDSSLKRICCQVWSLQRRRARAHTSFAVLRRCLRIGLNTGRLARIPDSRILLRTVWPEIRTYAGQGVQRTVSLVVIIRFLRWIRRKYLSWRCNVTPGLPLRVCHSSCMFVEDES